MLLGLSSSDRFPFRFEAQKGNGDCEEQTQILAQNILIIFLLQVRVVKCEKTTFYVRVNSKYSVGQKFNEIYFAISVFLRVIVPVIITIGSTALLVRFIQKRKRSAPSNNQQEQQKRQMDDLTVCLVAVAVCFLVFVFPFSATSITLYTNPTGCLFYNAQYIIVPLTLTNSSMNFFIYYWKLIPFRKAIKNLFCKGSSYEPSVASSETRSTATSSDKDLHI